MNADKFNRHFRAIKQFLVTESTFPLFDRTRNVRYGNKKGYNKWSDERKKIEQAGYKLHPLHGKCFVCSAFCYYFVGGNEKSNFILKTIKPQFMYMVLSNGEQMYTTHWFIEDDEGNIFDPTFDQFTYGYTPEDRYNTAIKAAIGWPYFRWKSAKSKKYNENVPSQEVLRLAAEYKKQYGSAGYLDVWLERSDKFRNEVDNEYS